MSEEEYHKELSELSWELEIAKAKLNALREEFEFILKYQPNNFNIIRCIEIVEDPDFEMSADIDGSGI